MFRVLLLSVSFAATTTAALGCALQSDSYIAVLSESGENFNFINQRTGKVYSGWDDEEFANRTKDFLMSQRSSFSEGVLVEVNHEGRIYYIPLVQSFGCGENPLA